MKTFKIITLGCKVNTYESEVTIEMLKKHGYNLALENEIPDLVIINTCAVTSIAGSKSRQMIHRARHNYPDAIIVSMGCYTQLEKDKLNISDIILGTNDKNKLVSLIEEFEQNKIKKLLVDNARLRKDYECINITHYEENTRAFVKIQDGCDNFCSYCIIPYTRGKSRSRKKEDVLNEVHTLVNNNYQEIVITGIDLASYHDGDNYSFVDLLKDILKEKKILRLRISSIEASQIDDDFIALILNEKRIASHLHIPLQSGSKSVLKRMNRKYTPDEFYKKIVKIKKANPLIALACDVIVGFPEETEEEFKETESFIKKCDFDYLHVFPYSNRPGTIAAKMKQTPAVIKKQRVKTLISEGEITKQRYYKRFDNQVLEVLFETCLADNITWKGYSSNYIEVYVKSSKSLHNKMVKVLYKYNDISEIIDE